VSFSFSGGSDASAADMAAGLTYSFDFDGDGVFEVSGSSPSATRTFARHGVYTVTGRVTDKDGGYTDYTTTVSVKNVAAVISSFSRDASNLNAAVRQHSEVVVSGAFYDPGLLDVVTVDWGDGTQTSGVQLQPGTSAGSWTFLTSHVYGTGGVYTVTLYVSDGSATVTSTLTAKVSGAKV
jgi:PKD repeat protein